MKNPGKMLAVTLVVSFLMACSTAYKAKPLRFKDPATYPNAGEIAGTTIGAKAFADQKEAKEAFGFDVRNAGLLPVQIVFDNQGSHSLRINAAQTFLEDEEGNLWPLLTREAAYERTAKYAETNKIFKEAAYHGFLGAAAGAVVGAAIGIVSGQNVAEAAGKGAAVGAAGGGLIGGVKGGITSEDARKEITNDLQRKSLENRAIETKNLTFGFLFFPGEMLSAKQLRLQLKEDDTGEVHVIKLNF